MVIGLRFVKKNRIIHLQVQEGKLLPRGKIEIDTAHWIPVEEYKITDKKIFNGQDYHTLSWEKRAIDLDDLEADEGHVLTGKLMVNFVNLHNIYELIKNIKHTANI